MLKRPQFEAALAGRAAAQSPHFALHVLHVSGSDAAALFAGPGPWIGALLPKRWARRAVTRNALRRQIYAVSAAANLPQGLAFVVRLRSAFAAPAFISASSERLKAAARTELSQLMARPAAAPASPAATTPAPRP